MTAGFFGGRDCASFHKPRWGCGRVADLKAYYPMALYLTIALVFPIVISVLVELIGRRPPDPVKLQPYESGYPTTPMTGRFPVKFYLIAMLFVIFDVEAAVLYPWTVVLGDLGAYGLAAMSLFLIVFVLGDLYVWKRGGLDWT